jgi:hypothetical protein
LEADWKAVGFPELDFSDHGGTDQILLPDVVNPEI